MPRKTQDPWPDPEEQRAWVNVVKVLLTLPSALESQLLRDSDLTLLGYMILARLSVVPDHRLRMSEVAEMAGGSLPRTSHAVGRLEARGWVTRTVVFGQGQGRRHTVATLTEAGRQQLAKAAPAHVATVRRLVVDPIGDDFAAFGAAAAQVVEALGLPRGFLAD